MTAYKKPTFFDRSIKSFSELSSASESDLGLELYKLKLTGLSTGVVHSNASGEMTSSLLVNADVDAAAAIAGTKISPDFGAQNVATTGTLSSGAATVTSLRASGLGLGVAHVDASGNFTSSTIVNADVSASAAIAGTKISPDFGSQNVTTTGNVSGAAGTFSGAVSASSATLGAGGGATTFSVDSSGNVSAAGTLSVTGATTLTTFSATGGTMTGALAMGANKITGLADPTAAQDGATKAYVDSVAQGLDVKASCVAATTANITLSGTQTIDGVAVVAGDRVLVKNQTTASANGIYVVAAGAWARSLDMDAAAEFPGAFTFIEGGTVNSDSGWVCTNDAPVTVGTTPITFSQFSGAGQIEAGAGLSKSANTLNVNVGAGIQISSDNVAVLLGTDPALTFEGASSNELAVLLQGSGSALSRSGGLHLVYSSDKALTVASNSLQVVADSTKALAIDAVAGLQVVADANYALEINSSSGLRVKVDGTRAIINGSGQVDVAGVPAQFEINDVATSANVTSANLGTLVDGPAQDAKALHSHSADAEYLTAATGAAAAQACIINASGEAATAGTTAAGAYAIGIIESIASGVARVVRGGLAVGVLSGATAGDAYYVQSDGTISASLPASGRCVMIGVAKSATDLHVQVRDYGSILAA